jgi:hypothetical protein
MSDSVLKPNVTHYSSLMLCYILKDKASDLIEVHNWINLLEVLLLFLIKSFNIKEAECVKEDIVLLFGFALKKMVSDNILVEYSIMYKEFVLRILEVISDSEPSSNIKKLYNNSFITSDGYCLIKDLIFTEGAIIEYLGENKCIAKELEKLACSSLKFTIKKIRNSMHIELVKQRESRDATYMSLKAKEQEILSLYQ